MKLSLVPLFFLASRLWASDLSDVLAPLPSGKTVTLTTAQISQLFSLAAEKNWNVFDLLDEACLYLKANEKRVHIDGTDMRTVARGFNLGGRRVDTLLPLPLLESLSAGARLGSKADIEIKLIRPFSAFLELGDFDLEPVYGFRTVGEKELGEAFGVTVKNGIFHWTLQKVARVPDPTGKGSPNFIAIHLDNFFRPKRWKIEPIIVLGQQPKP
jgi:hypothetical protein